MVIKSSLPLPHNKETVTEREEHVLITEYLIGTNKTINETKEDEHSIIAVSPNDHRWYRLIELRNGLRCMLVTNNSYEDEEDEDDERSNQYDTDDKLLSSDADEAFFKYHMATVALYIPAGSLLDPSNSQGLAHLTEHLLFSSSSKYPEINCLDTFVSYHGGTIHAYTELEFTVILIEISSNRVVETLDILIHSFIDPLMSPEAIYDQIQIIDDESTIAQFDDYYRTSRLLAYLAKENHPIRNFSWGNKKSLKDFVANDNSSTILKQFVKDRYCVPEGMNLVMISNESFRIMQQRIERLFCLMKRSFKTLPDYIGLKEPWNTDNFKKFHLVYLSEDIHQLRISFPLPSIDEYWKIKPEDYIRFIFAHDAPGSLNSYLKNKLWTTNVDFDIGDSQLYHNSSSSLFTMILHLTRQGLKNLHSIIDSVFEAINLLKRLGPLKRVYDDIQLADLHAFLFQEKSDTITYADTIARNLRKYPSLFVLFGHNLHLQFEPVSIFKTINALDPRTCNIMLISRLCLPYCDQIEPWFNIQYGQFDIPNYWISYWLNPNINPALTIPDSSQYLAVDFSIKPFDIPSNEVTMSFFKVCDFISFIQIPIILLEEDFGTLWYFRNQETLPKGFLRAIQLPAQQSIVKIESCQSNDCATHMSIFFEHGITSIRDYILLEIIAEIIQESLEDYLQTAGSNHFTCNVTLRDTYGIISLQIELMFSSEIYNSMDVVDYVSKFFVHFKDLIMETTTVEFERLVNMFRNAKQNIDNSLQACVDRYWTEIILNSFIFDRNNQERNALDSLTVTDMQEWYNEHIFASTRRQLIIIVCSNDEIKRTSSGIISNNRISHVSYDNQRNQYSIRSSVGVPIERLPRLVRRQDLLDEDDDDGDGHISLLQSKSDSKLRCLTTKRKHNIDLYYDHQ
ncbi:unnamed protein product [Rotaria sp. Silwood2]|nr:unnamed protein product [Rotaria sp. Silwood2]